MSLDKLLTDKWVLSGTGSRTFWGDPSEEATMDRLRTFIERQKAKFPNLVVLSGGAEGWDASLTYAATACSVPYYLSLPNSRYGNYYWGRKSTTGQNNLACFDLMVAQAVAVECTSTYLGLEPGDVYGNCGTHLNLLRNERMVSLAQGFLVYKPTSPGTRHCVGLLDKLRKPYRILG